MVCYQHMAGVSDKYGPEQMPRAVKMPTNGMRLSERRTDRAAVPTYRCELEIHAPFAGDAQFVM